jgi:hypothetical protein
MRANRSRRLLAVGGGTYTLAERWDGTSWTVQSTPSPSPIGSRPNATGALSGVSCVSETSCTAVGSYADSTGREVTLAEGYAG